MANLTSKRSFCRSYLFEGSNARQLVIIFITEGSQFKGFKGFFNYFFRSCSDLLMNGTVPESIS